MSQDLSLEEQIDMVMISIQKRLLVSVIFTTAVFLLQGIVIILLSFLFDQQILSLLLLIFGILVSLVGLYVLTLSIKSASETLYQMSLLEQELPTPSDDNNQRE